MDNRVVYRRRRRLLDRRRQRSGVDRARCTPTTRPPWPGPRTRACRTRATPWRWARRRADRRHRRLGRQRARARRPGSTTRRATRGRLRPTHRCRCRPPARRSSTASCTSSVAARPRVHADVERRRRRTTRRPTAGSTLADYPARWPSPPAVGSTGGLLHRRQRRAAGDGRQLRLRPGRRHLDRDRRRPGRPLGQRRTPWPTAQLLVNGGVAGWRDHQRTLRLRPGCRAWSDLPNSNTARYRGGMACGLYKIGGSSGGFTATVRTARCCPGSRTAAPRRPTSSGCPSTQTSATLAPGRVDRRSGHDGPERRPARHLLGSVAIARERTGIGRAGRRDDDRQRPRGLGQAGRHGHGQLLQRAPWHRSPEPPCRWTRGPVRGRSRRSPTAGYAYWFNSRRQPADADRGQGRLRAADPAGPADPRRGDPSELHAQKVEVLALN